MKFKFYNANTKLPDNINMADVHHSLKCVAYFATISLGISQSICGPPTEVLIFYLCNLPCIWIQNKLQLT